jgi:hypothetical protein
MPAEHIKVIDILPYPYSTEALTLLCDSILMHAGSIRDSAVTSGIVSHRTPSHITAKLAALSTVPDVLTCSVRIRTQATGGQPQNDRQSK